MPRRPDRVLSALAALVGVAVGVAGFTFAYAKGGSYLGNDPRACANCHVMNEPFDAWVKGSHRSVATCNDCHTPHGLVPKYLVKARNGFLHSYYFTFGGFPEPIRITEASRRVTESQCRRCHESVVSEIDASHRSRLDCLICHRDVGHLH